MSRDSYLKPKELIFALLAFGLVLFIHGAVPFLMLPTLGQAVWSTGFSLSIANGSLFEFYANDFGVPKPAAIAFGLAGAWPVSLLIRLGMSAADAYAAMAAGWLGLAMFSAYLIVRRFGGTKLIALSGAVIWMTMPVIWAHAGYSMLSLGIALFPFYFLSAIRLFLIETNTSQIAPTSFAFYVIAAVVSVFMDGYTFMMFATGASILLIYTFLTRAAVRSKLFKIVIPIHVFSFALAYVLYSLYIGKLHFETHSMDFFRGWGLDLSFFAIPTKGILWLPDLLGISVARTDELHFGDASVWETTFALPVLILSLFSWARSMRRTKITTGILIVAFFGFYMALGPSLKINSKKTETLKLTHPRQQSALMPPEYAIAPTGNAWISEKLPGFNVMRASYRWSALSIFAMWLLIIIWIASADRRELRFCWGLLFVLFLLNLPDYDKGLRSKFDNRMMFQQIDEELVAALRQKIRSNEIVVFLPWGNDFFANYLAPKVGFRTFNIGGDKNLATAQSLWPRGLLALGGEVDAGKVISYLKLLKDGTADVIILPYFHMLWSPHFWPCQKESTIPGFICPAERRAVLNPVITAFLSLPYVEVTETDLFVTVRLRHVFASQANRLDLLSSIVGSTLYPISIESNFVGVPHIAQDGSHDLGAHNVW